ncbi:hypothetical protein KRR38_27480 [Novosphingobium sp. G106]|uniref:hypothetical protein n=1 Tax=Novosphingobium sp. G106 TaxID=2849500 RepID=UPI001C2DC833|nr:hypothetical protein [Novosphingobium sp. G106]MBV1691326.1 hypothetical protein [Novosphingobium sp. G106]
MITTQLGGKWNVASGSSFAAAHVSGLFALLRAKSRGNALTLVTLRGEHWHRRLRNHASGWKTL